MSGTRSNMKRTGLIVMTISVFALIPQPLLPILGEGEQILQSPSPKYPQLGSRGLGEGFSVRARSEPHT
jgi:hypothetical protein